MTRYTLTCAFTEDHIPFGTTVLHILDYWRTSLVVPPSVTDLYCYDNHLRELIVPPSVTTLDCYNNELTELIVPPSVTKMYCGNNQLTELIVPPSVTTLYCDNNQLTELIVPSLTKVYCENNIYPEEILLIRGRLSHIRKRIAVRKAIRRMRKQFYRRKENVLNEITSRPSSTVGAWDKGGKLFQDNMEEALKYI